MSKGRGADSCTARIAGPGVALRRTRATGVSLKLVADASCRSALSGAATRRSRPSPAYTPAMPRTLMPAWSRAARIRIAAYSVSLGGARRTTMPARPSPILPATRTSMCSPARDTDTLMRPRPLTVTAWFTSRTESEPGRNEASALAPTLSPGRTCISMAAQPTRTGERPATVASSEPMRRGSPSTRPSTRVTPRRASSSAMASRCAPRSDGSPLPRRMRSLAIVPSPPGGDPDSSVRKRQVLPRRKSAVAVASTF